MILLLLAAWADPCSPEAAVGILRGDPGDLKTAYLCLATDERGDDLTVAALDATPAAPAPDPAAPLPTGSDADMARARYTRALALWLLNHADVQWDPSLVRRLPAVDRRLLADGVRALRGRESASPEHVKVLQNFSWYKPDPTYTDGRLSAIDRANIAMADKPPPAPPPLPAAMAAADGPGGAPPTPPPSTGGCGCAGTPGALGLGAGLAALLLSAARRSGAGGATPR